jgi:decaprenylphospho-beta-D-erythro-pentofuranosid-2-ulose 2-reductase
VRDSLGRFQTVAVFGAGSDIASAALRELLRDGPFTALLCARDPGGLETSYLEAAGATVERHDFDALVFESHAALLDTLFSRDGDVDLVLVAFGLLADQGDAERDAALARALVQTNFTAAVSILTPLVERLLEQGHGTVVVLSSIAAVRARRSNYVYGSAKAGLDAFCQGLQLRLRGSGVTLVIVRPGFVRTKMTVGLKPLPFALSAEEAGVAIVNGLRAGETTIWAPGAMRAAALVLRLLPRRLLGSL